MTTLPHENNANGYSLRIGKHVPKHAANLAYVHTDTPEPEKNVLIDDYTLRIPENNPRLDEQLTLEAFVNADGQLESTAGPVLIDRPSVLLTNEYSLDNAHIPLPYVHRSRYLFDARGHFVRYPLNGKAAGEALLFDTIQEDSAIRFVLDSDQVVLRQKGGQPLPEDKKYKVILEKAGETAYLYRLVIYTSFDSEELSAELYYPAHEHSRQHKETVNVDTLFNENQSVSNDESTRSYVLKQASDGRYSIHLPVDGETFVVNETNRPGQSFQYQLLSNVTTRLSDKNPLTVKIGIIYINDTVINATRTVGALKKLVQNNPFMPDYLNFENPHAKSGYHDKSDSTYWEADLTMPKDHWLDYDVLILTGYGDKDFSNVSAAMRDYLDTGALLLLDTAGEGTSVLNPVNQNGDQTFVANISYSPTQNETAHRVFTEQAQMRDRYYDVKHPERLGRIAPQVRFHGEENSDDWDVFLRHQNGGPALMRKRTEEAGQLVVSNMGWMLDVLFGKTEAIQFFSNFLLFALEQRRFVSPVFNDYVYHKDDLYPEEYLSPTGEVLYYDDKNDEDNSQIVAKKQLHPNVTRFARQYLPNAYRRPETASYTIKLEDSGDIPLVNGRFEQASSTGVNDWEVTTLDALPGFDFVRFSGDSTRGEHTTALKRSGTRSLMVKTLDAQGFFEQEIGVLPEGRYELTGFVKGNQAAGGGIALYDENGERLTQSTPASGTFHWRKETLLLTLNESTKVFLRLGAHSTNTTTELYFDDLSFKTTSVIRMNPKTQGNEPLYAYTVSPKGKNTALNQYERQQIAASTLRIDAKADLRLVVRSFVYQWESAAGRFKKSYGNQKETRVQLKTSDRERVLGNLQTFLPALKSGAEWARKDRVYYEIGLAETDLSDFVNLKLYDPSIDRYFFTPNGDWVINHDDIWWNGYDATVQLRGELLLYRLERSGHLYTVKEKQSNQIRVNPPRTQDERDRWYLSIQNGAFHKRSINSSDQEELVKGDRADYYQAHLTGEHDYQLPEYRRQSFYPRVGERLITGETARYVDAHRLKVMNTPLMIKEEQITKGLLRPLDTDRTIWQSDHIHWDKTNLPAIYLDAWNDGTLTLLNDAFHIDYTNGRVILEAGTSGTLYASYRHDNFVIRRRRYASHITTGELLRSRDHYTFDIAAEHLAVSPAPVFYRGTRQDDARIEPSRYWIDYEAGTVTFFNETRERIYADYLSFEEDELTWVDVDRHTGLIQVEERLSFKDELVVTYVAKEDHYIYKGYYDETLDHFMHLDLNPTAGHTFALKEKVGNQWQVSDAPSEKLLNKEIFIYLLPYRSLHYKTETTELYPTRHVFGEDEWQMIKTTYPQAQLLARALVRENTTPENIVVMDARRPGGGLKAHITQADIEQRIGYTSAFWDVNGFDGMAYYKNGVTIIRVPARVLKDNGGPFTEDDVQRSVEHYLAYGVYALIEYIEEDTE